MQKKTQHNPQTTLPCFIPVISHCNIMQFILPLPECKPISLRSFWTKTKNIYK